MIVNRAVAREIGRRISMPRVRPLKLSVLTVVLAQLLSAEIGIADDAVIDVLPGDPIISGDTTKPHTSRWAMTRISMDGEIEQTGVWLDRHEILNVDGRTVHKFQTDVVRTTGQPRREIVYWDQETMETISAEFENYNQKGGWAHFIYDGDRVAQVYRREPLDDTYSNSKVLEFPAFEPGHGLVFAILLDIQVAGKLRYPYHDRTSDEIKWITLEAVRHETIDTPNYGGVETLLLESSQGWKYWTVADLPYVYRLDIPRANGEIDRWELLEFFAE